MPSPPALTCISAADGDPKWVHDPRAVEASDNGDKDINREPCALDRREFASSALRVARFLAFSPAVVLWVVLVGAGVGWCGPGWAAVDWYY